MNDTDLANILSNIEEKLGKDQNALIADDLGEIITRNNEALTKAKERDTLVNRLTSERDKLVAVNGRLLQQIPMAPDDIEDKKKEKEVPKKDFNFKSMFDSKGRFKQNLD